MQVVLYIQNSPKERSERCLKQARDPQNPVSSQKLSLVKQGRIKRVLGQNSWYEVFVFLACF